MRVAKEDTHKTAFTGHGGTYRFTQLLYGVMNVPATFEQALDIIRNKYMWKPCLEYLDNVIIFSKINHQHLKNIEDVLLSLYSQACLST